MCVLSHVTCIVSVILTAIYGRLFVFSMDAAQFVAVLVPVVIIYSIIHADVTEGLFPVRAQTEIETRTVT